MAEIMDGKGLKIIPFYLPQFHTIPENDQWWGEGFTEWTNVRKAVPLFEGHQQPKLPLGDNYYNLLDDETKIWQAELAKQYGIFGFCYYHYWFKGGKKLLEKPAEQMLKNKNIQLPFCFSWANENWSRNWDGGNHEIIMPQEYGGKQEWELHFQYLLPFFRDERYMTINGKPLFVIYKPEQIIEIAEMAGYFRKRAVEEGFPGICLAFQFPSYYADMYYREDVFDYRIEFEPVYSRNLKSMKKPGTARSVQSLRSVFGETPISFYRKKSKHSGGGYPNPEHLSVFFYDEAWKKILENEMDEKFLPGGFVDWDNTPRNKHGVMYAGFTVDKFREYMTRLVKKARDYDKPVVFLNAWNEWSEGAYLEPDNITGYAKLEAVKAAFDAVG
ncbi:MAG: glycoside hydrolase family 99-like domain-containing protein [Clostridiales bacterium]|nr:glycoside hydrolase family 99-like domain-containing protein [Clostridiales bacterium]